MQAVLEHQAPDLGLRHVEGPRRDATPPDAVPDAPPLPAGCGSSGPSGGLRAPRPSSAAAAESLGGVFEDGGVYV